MNIERSIADALNDIRDEKLSIQDRLKSIQRIGKLWQEQQESHGGNTGRHLKSSDLPGLDEVVRLAKNRDKAVELRSEAAALVAKAQNVAALDLCIDLLKEDVK